MSNLTDESAVQAFQRREALAKLREPFPPSAIGSLPRGGTTLSYVGHAAVTARLLDVDTNWNWEPLALDERGLPAFDRDQQGRPVGLWIKLTVLGMTRLGYGSVVPGAFDAEKQLVGDAIRNAAMRFGVALDLWSKEDISDTTLVSDKEVEELDRLTARFNSAHRVMFGEWWKQQQFPPKKSLSLHQYATVYTRAMDYLEEQEEEDAGVDDPG